MQILKSLGKLEAEGESFFQLSFGLGPFPEFDVGCCEIVVGGGWAADGLPVEEGFFGLVELGGVELGEIVAGELVRGFGAEDLAEELFGFAGPVLTDQVVGEVV